MANFAAALVRRYGPGGAFWASHPGIPYLPIRAWQVWNEPNLVGFWAPQPDAAAYARLLSVVSAAIKSADPGAQVVTAGLPESTLPGAIPLADYLNGIFDAGAGNAFDILAIHPYSSGTGETLAQIADARQVLSRRGSSAPIWITELGWATAGPPSKFTVGDVGQASLIKCTLTALAQERDTLGVAGVVYYFWRDPPPRSDGYDNWHLHTGLLDPNGAQKPGYQAFSDTALALERNEASVTEPEYCDNVGQPATTAATAATLQPQFYGMASWAVDPPATDLVMLSRARIGTYRSELFWAGVEPHEGWRIWSEYDDLMTNADRAGLTVLPKIFGTPGWLGPTPGTPPRSREAIAAYLAFVRDAVRRYGPNGDFWNQHPQLRYNPVREWQVWEEPNVRNFWGGRPNARQYALLVQRTADTIHSVDPGAKIVLAGLNGVLTGGRSPAGFLRRLYTIPNVERSFDAVALDPRSKDTRSLGRALRGIRRAMRRAGDARTPLWITALGFPTGGPRDPLRVTNGGQAFRLRHALSYLLRYRARFHIRRVIMWALRDRPLYPGEPDTIVPHAGVFDTAGRPKAGWVMLLRFTRPGAPRYLREARAP
jgi:hypothetical protein